jgi:tetratricopeptide (TPR) repeat protein
MSTSPSNNNHYIAVTAGVISPVISVVLAYSGPTLPNITISFFLLAVLGLFGWILIKEGYKMAAVLYLFACLIVFTSSCYLIYSRLFPHPSRTSEIFNEGKDLYDKQSFFLATEKFQEALKIKDDYWEARMYLGKCHSALGKYQEARDELQKVYDVAPNIVKCDLISAIRNMAEDLCRKGNSKKAIGCITALSDLDYDLYVQLLSKIGNC